MAEITKVDLMTGVLSGMTRGSETLLGGMAGLYEDEGTRSAMPQDEVIYKVQMHCCEEEGVKGGLFFGTSFLNPGLVGDEYFMTKGHYHSERDTAEYYWCISGQGMLLLMDEKGDTTWQELTPGTLCYIPRYYAHRLVNTGGSVLAVGACWPSNAGHDYGSILAEGFGVRVKKTGDIPTVVPNKRG